MKLVYTEKNDETFRGYLNLGSYGFELKYFNNNDPLIVDVVLARKNGEKEDLFNYTVSLTREDVKNGISIASFNYACSFHKVIEALYQAIGKVDPVMKLQSSSFINATVFRFPDLNDENYYQSINKAIKDIKFINSENVLELDLLKEVATLVNKYVVDQVIPFYERISSLQIVNDEIIDKLPQNKLMAFLYSHIIQKKQVIMKLCSNPKYQEFVDFMEQAYQKGMAMDKMRYEKDYEKFQMLSQYLDANY